MTGLFFNHEQRQDKDFLAAFFCLLLGLGFALFPAAGQAQRFLSNETRSLKIYFVHIQEKEEVVFKKNGHYVRSSLKRLNYLLHDWRHNEAANMDPRLFDLVWQIYQLSISNAYIHAVSAYRSPQTNAILRLGSPASSVARHSRHMEGKATDFYLPDVNPAYLRAIALKLQGGGIGYYPASASPFVHIDVGRIRHWPRMSRPALAELFPDGRTLHVPANNLPFAAYAEAAADYKECRGATLPVFSARALFGGLLPSSVILAMADGRISTGRGRDIDKAAAAPLPAAAPHFNAGAQEIAEAEEIYDEVDAEKAFIPIPQFKYKAGDYDEIGALSAYAPVFATDNAAAGAVLQAFAELAPVPETKPLLAAAGKTEAAAKIMDNKSDDKAPTAGSPLTLPRFKPYAGQDAVGALIAQNKAVPFHNIPLPLEKVQKEKRRAV